MGLHPYAEAFVAAGLAVFVFDYRTFGGSDGLPRQWGSWRRYLQDWEAALRHVVSSSGMGDVGGVMRRQPAADLHNHSIKESGRCLFRPPAA